MDYNAYKSELCARFPMLHPLQHHYLYSTNYTGSPSRLGHTRNSAVCTRSTATLLWHSCPHYVFPALIYSVSQKKSPRGFVAIIPKRLRIFRPNFTCLLCIPIYARLQIFIQLFATLTKLCHIKRDHQVHMCTKCPPSPKTHFLTFFPNS